jgi:hypothetical protein
MDVLRRRACHPRRRCVGVLSILCALLLAMSSGMAAAAGAEIGEEQVKAAFLYKFGAYVEWPAAAFERPDSAIVIGVVGDAALAAELQRIASGRQIGGRDVVVRALAPEELPTHLQVLFIGVSEQTRVDEIVSRLHDVPALIVTESEQAQPSGSVINFVVVDNRVRFDVALAAAERRQLKISSLLLAVARQVDAVPR